nr:HI1450 family dsDNA-mimic protein [uncultured Moellerella sp.]
MEFSTNNPLISEDDTIDMAYDLFLEGALEHLDPADQLIFSLQFEERGAVEVVDLQDDWSKLLNKSIDKRIFSEVIIGLAENEDAELDDIFARVLISRDIKQPFVHIIWRT